jgi:hypothetical protein
MPFRVPKTGRFAANPKGFRPFSDRLTPGIAAYSIEMMHIVYAVMRDYAQEMQDYAQENAPWEDQTGDARAGLEAIVEEHPVRPVIYLYHTVDYGKWLEIRWNGLYAVIMPTIEDKGPGLMKALEGA